MPTRVAGILSLIVFAMCLCIGTFEAENSFGTVVWRGLVAMGGSYVVGYVIGLMAESMIDERSKQLIAEGSKFSKGSAMDGR
jgi:Na+/H+-dicarboxylate symporter